MRFVLKTVSRQLELHIWATHVTRRPANFGACRGPSRRHPSFTAMTQRSFFLYIVLPGCPGPARFFLLHVTALRKECFFFALRRVALPSWQTLNFSSLKSREAARQRWRKKGRFGGYTAFFWTYLKTSEGVWGFLKISEDS